jgi:UDP-N-acetylmuramoyl-tripeptide--D-alanyl-D-alanine ligase
MGTIEAVAKAKYELIENLPDDGIAIINADDRFLSEWLGKIRQKAITYGIDSKADYRVTEIEYTSSGVAKFDISGTRFRINLPGKHNLYNAAAAIVAANKMGCDNKDLVEVLANLKPYKLRSEVFESNGATFINDCYNANPSSMKAAIDTLSEFPSKGRKIAVLADMLELGEREIAFHKEIGEYLSLKRADALFAYGKLGEIYIENFDGKFKMHFTDKKQLTSELKDYMRPGDIVLVKGSRGMALEEVSEAFRGNS